MTSLIKKTKQWQRLISGETRCKKCEKARYYMNATNFVSHGTKMNFFFQVTLVALVAVARVLIRAAKTESSSQKYVVLVITWIY